MSTSATMRYGILGPLVVDTGNGSVDLGGPKQRAVLALLLVNANHPLTPDQLVDSLWGERAPPTATGTLQSYISNLRRLLEPDRPARAPASILVKNGGGYQMTVRPDEVDALRFEVLVGDAATAIGTDPHGAREQLLEALSLWRGPALADFRYDDFARTEVVRLEEMRVTALELRIAADLELGRSAEVVGELEELVAVHPLRERLWSHLMLALYRTGRQAEALRAYKRCSDILGEMGIVPGEDLRRLELAILNQDPRLTAVQAPPTEAPAPGGGEIVGRIVQRRRFRAALERAAKGAGTILVLEGEAGVGKTKLLETLQLDAADFGCRTAFARCVEVGGTPPFWPWIQLVRQLGTENIGAAAGRYAPYLDPLLPHGEPTAAAPGSPLFRVAEGLAVALGAMAATVPLVLVIDDVYSADPDSLSLLSLLAAEIEKSPVVIAVSHRDDASTAALRSTLTELSRLDWVERMLVPRLDDAETAELIGRLGSDNIDDSTRTVIFNRSEGNAFFTIELTKLLVAEHELRPEAVATVVPATVLEVIDRRLGRLSPDALSLVRVGAVCGRTFDLTVACEAVELDLARGVSAIEEPVRSGLLAEAKRPGTYRFSHIIVVDTVTHALGAMRRAQLHHGIADALERRHSHNPGRWVEIAHHRTEAVPITGPGPAIAALARAGSHAIGSNALQLAQELLHRRLDLLLTEPHTPDRDTREMTALMDLAPVWTWQEGYNSPRLRLGAERLWELTGLASGTPVFDTTRPIESSHPLLAAMQARFSVDMVSGDLSAAQEVVDLLLRLAEDHPFPMVVYAANQTACTVWTHSGRIAGAVAAVGRAEEALRVLDPGRTNRLMLPLGQQPAWITHYAFSGRAFWLAGDNDRARREFRAGRALCDRLGNPFITAFATSAEGFVAAIAGDVGWVTEVHSWGESHRTTEIFGPIEQWRVLQAAWAQGMLGLDPSAAAEMRAALDALAAQGALVATTGYWALLAQLELENERPVAALDALDRGISRAQTSGEHFWYAELERLSAEALHALGRTTEADMALARAEKAADEIGVVPVRQRLAGARRSG